MIISMQGSWLVRVKSKSASFPHRYVISGAAIGNGVHAGTSGNSVFVSGDQWSIAIQNNPGSGFQLSDARIKFPKKVGWNYEFDIESNDAGSDQDFNDLILTCTTPININKFILYGNVSLYSGRCIFNPCRRFPFVIESHGALLDALKNPKLKDLVKKLYPERIPVGPLPPDPGPFKPMVIDLFEEATQPNTRMVYQRMDTAANTTKAKAKRNANEMDSNFNAANYKLVSSDQKITARELNPSASKLELAKVIDGLLYNKCNVGPGSNTTLTFEEYDRTGAELAGGAYTGTGNRRMLGDTITDMHGNYIFLFTFDMSFPGLEDSDDQAPGESIEVVAYPDIIVKVTGFSPYTVLYESVPYYNIPNLKRIDLCLPKSSIQPSSACFNGNLIGSLGNVFLGGNQNSNASFASTALRRYGNNNELESTGKISVGGGLAGFNINCAAWGGTIDFKGCMYDLAKTASQNKIRWYTMRIRRSGTSNWQFVSENYKHPKFSKRHLPNYIGDDVGPFPKALKVDGGAAVEVPAYINIQREIFVDGIDWEFSNLTRYMRLNTRLYDLIAGVRTPGKFYVRVDGYDNAGNLVADATDMIALYIHNNPLDFQLVGPTFTDPSIVNAGCGLYRLTEAQLNAPMQIAFKANDPHGFVHSFALTMGRCPAPMIGLQVNSPNPPISNTVSGQSILTSGNASANVPHDCVGYTGTIQEFSDAGLINVNLQPAASEGGWIKAAEYFTTLSFTLTAYKRVTNGYNSGLSDDYHSHAGIHMERINP